MALSKTTSAQPFHESLPISGRDGTLGGRLKALTDQVSAKTGSLTYDNSLSGYLTASSGEVLVFSVMCNDQTARTNSSLLIDQIVSVLASYPNFSPKNE
jgi:D-alanyl-D-alanine carboxypeptidase/D-alanyl-D-alanine-endopeptidase (penicillin-binding protein 4)